MQSKFDTITDLEGNALPGANVRVVKADGSATTIYRDNGGQAQPNPIDTDAYGRFSFYAANGDYKLEVSVKGKVLYTSPAFTLYDPDDDSERVTLSALAGNDGADKIGNDGKTVAQNLQELSEAIGAVGGGVPARVDALEEEVAQFGTDAGAGLIGFKQAGTGTVASTVLDELRDRASVRQFGAKEDGGTDDLAAINAALAASKRVAFKTGATYRVSGLPAFDGHAIDGADVTLVIDAGAYNYTTPRKFSDFTGGGFKIQGPAVSTYIATAASATGSAKAWDVVFEVPSSAGVSVGDYMLVRTTAGTGNIQWVQGIWKVVAVGAGSFTLRNTGHFTAAPSIAGLTSATIRRLPVVLNFAGCDGFIIRGGNLALLDNMALVGDWNVAAATGTTGAHAIVVGAPTITGGASSNAAVAGGGGVTTGANVGLYGWGEQGIAAEQGGSMSINFLASCGNRKRGIYVSTCVGARGKFSITNGNGEDGVITDENGAGAFSLGVSCGNGLNGYWATNGSFLNAASTISIGNLTSGYEVRGAGRMTTDSSTSALNGAKGYSVTDGGMMDADAATADSNASDGFYAFMGAVIDANNATAKNNGGWGVNPSFSDVNFSGSGTFTGNALGTFNTGALGVRGYTNSNRFPFTTDAVLGTIGSIALRAGYDAAKHAEFVSTSIGDLVIRNNGTNSFILKAQGPLTPAGDNTQALGNVANRWSTVYAGTGAINTSDKDAKQDIANIDDAAIRAIRRVGFKQFRFRDAVAAKGEAARLHLGVIAQEVKAAFESEGVDPFKYGVLCYDEWPEQPAVFGEDGQVLTPYQAAGSRYGVRHDELFSLKLAAMESAAQDIKN